MLCIYSLKVFFAFTLILVSTLVNAGKISISFDDAPNEDRTLFSGIERTNKLVKILKDHNVQTVFYVNSKKFNKSNGRARIKKYAKTGHLIANHTHSHPDLRKISPDEYIKDIKKADLILRNMDNFVPWFRYPYLAHGETLKTRDRVRNFLTTTGYTNGYVTIDNQDWFMSALVEELSLKYLKRSPPPTRFYYTKMNLLSYA